MGMRVEVAGTHPRGERCEGDRWSQLLGPSVWERQAAGARAGGDPVHGGACSPPSGQHPLMPAGLQDPWNLRG